MEKNSVGADIRLGGLITAILSLVTGLIFAFATPDSCSLVGGLGVVFFSFLVVAGIMVFFSGLIVEKRSRRAAS
ncbi:hypothetical protein ACFLUG_01350 [Chloroflexota bacterium]